MRELTTGLSKLLTLGLDGHPAADIFNATIAVWTEVVCAGRVWDEQRDIPRFRKAFRVLMATSERWPTPKKFLDAMPSNVVPFQKLPRLEAESRRAAGFQALAEINKKLGIPGPRNRDDDPEPPRAA